MEGRQGYGTTFQTFPPNQKREDKRQAIRADQVLFSFEKTWTNHTGFARARKQKRHPKSDDLRDVTRISSNQIIMPSWGILARLQRHFTRKPISIPIISIITKKAWSFFSGDNESQHAITTAIRISRTQLIKIGNEIYQKDVADALVASLRKAIEEAVEKPDQIYKGKAGVYGNCRCNKAYPRPK